MASRLKIGNLTIINGKPLEPGWSGKLWALQQGLPQVQTKTILLLDADIRLEPGAIPALQARMQQHDLHLVSLLAFLRMDSFWEKLLMPAFVYFFKLLYPFHLSNKGSKSRRRGGRRLRPAAPRFTGAGRRFQGHKTQLDR